LVIAGGGGGVVVVVVSGGGGGGVGVGDLYCGVLQFYQCSNVRNRLCVADESDAYEGLFLSEEDCC